jgi:hypothetical protein
VSNREVHRSAFSGLRAGYCRIGMEYLAREAQQQARKQQAAERGVKHEIDSHGREYSEFRAGAQPRHGGGGAGRARRCLRQTQ